MATCSSYEEEDTLKQLQRLNEKQSLEIIHLKDENAKLQHRLSAILELQGHGRRHDNNTDSDHQDSPHLNDHRNFSILKQAYETLQAEHAARGQELEKLRLKYAKASDSVHKWDIFLKKHKHLLAQKDTSALTPAASDSKGEPTVSADDEPSKLASSQSTVVETQQPEVLDDDEAEFVAERQIKRRKLNRTPKIKQEPGTFDVPVTILSSSPEVITRSPMRKELSQISDLNSNSPIRVRQTFKAKQTPEFKTEPRKVLSDIGNIAPIGIYTPNAKRRQPKTARLDFALSVDQENLVPPIKSSHRRTLTPRQATPKFRTLPLEHLTLSHFKRNPRYTGPSMLHHTTPLARETGRVCLPTCTRWDCCGRKWQDRIEDLGTEISGATDKEALEQYRGPEYAALYKAASAKDKIDMLKKAHAYWLACQNGATSNPLRPPSPPGAHRIDMPSTQELEEQNRIAAENDKARIAERYHEAMRYNGSWLFGDEA